MKSNKFIFLAVSVLVLGACSAAKDKTESSTNKQANSSKVSMDKKEAEKDQTSSQDTRSESLDGTESKKEQKQEVTVDKNVSYNGSYYSVQGKYDEIVIANKHYPLSADYNPGEDPTAKAELLRLIADMQAKGYPISDQYSGFRSYQTQVGLYQSYANRDGQAAADRYSARPGYSEHQTGLAFDLIDNRGNLVEEAGASQWLLDNAYKYGFVVRYPVGKEASTGYMPESWHLRYVGKEAKEISESGLTLEEYYHFTGGNYVQ